MRCNYRLKCAHSRQRHTTSHYEVLCAGFFFDSTVFIWVPFRNGLLTVSHVPRLALAHANPTPNCLQVPGPTICAHPWATDASAQSPRQSPICSHERMPTRYARNPTQHSDPSYTPTCMTRDPLRTADLSALRADLQYCTPSRDPRHQISACRADLPAEPICNPIHCPPSRSALRPDLHADSRSSRREICSPKLARLRVCTLSEAKAKQ